MNGYILLLFIHRSYEMSLSRVVVGKGSCLYDSWVTIGKRSSPCSELEWSIRDDIAHRII